MPACHQAPGRYCGPPLFGLMDGKRLKVRALVYGSEISSAQIGTGLTSTSMSSALSQKAVEEGTESGKPGRPEHLCAPNAGKGASSRCKQAPMAPRRC